MLGKLLCHHKGTFNGFLIAFLMVIENLSEGVPDLKYIVSASK